MDSKLDSDSYFWLKKLFWGRSRRIWPKKHYFTSPFGQTPLGNSIAMATPKVPGDQKLLERVCYITVAELYKKKNSKFPPPPVQNRVKEEFVSWLKTNWHQTMATSIT